MRKKVLIITSTILCMLLCLGAIFSINSTAYNSKWDVGNYNDYGSYDGGYDYSGGGDSFDFGSSNNYDYSSSDSSASLNGLSGFGIVPVLIVIILIVIVMMKKGKGTTGTTGTAKPLRVAKPGNHQSQILLAINKIDPDFSDIKFVAWAKENFIILQQAWTDRDWSKIRPFEKEELFNQHELQLNEYIKLRRINYIENINISDAYLHLYRRDNQYEYLTIYLSTRMIDYIVDENTGNVIKGSKDKYCYIDYLMTYMRKKGVKTTIKDNAKANICPHCGAPLEAISSAGQCDYCGCIVTNGEFDWVLAEMDALRPGLSINESGVIISETPENNK